MTDPVNLNVYNSSSSKRNYHKSQDFWEQIIYQGGVKLNDTTIY